MLQQILTDMYIDPELLAELNEEQKQTLFFKMRGEQIRRWKEKEAQLEKQEVKAKKPSRRAGKQVSWLHSSNDDVWVWVMGEHPTDTPYEQICDAIMAERAARQAQDEAEQLRAQKEKELVKRFSKIYMDPEVELCRQEEEQKEHMRQEAAEEQRKIEEELKRKEAEERQKAEEEVQRLAKERAEQIYMNLKEVHQNRERQEKEDREWQETLRRSKAADTRRRSLAKQTREDHQRRSLKALERGRVAAMTKAYQAEERPALLPKPKPRTLKNEPLARKPAIRRMPSTSNREDIIRWFREEQLPLRAGFRVDHSGIAVWFHGIITRQEAEALLGGQKPGAFLIRVSERIMGFVLSYRYPEGFKHFLIDATDSCYMLLGDQIKFTTLTELVEYHMVEPITMSGGEELLYPCGQSPGHTDYTELFY
ncbi:SH2 domain-containing protein 4A isoform X1 [Paramormyrops kingsleyae]|uniref:SH2 domain-containing protein 4A isoform X1 n=1 Tax=Paramormyrops kingsleyae TaxID=1676925 RepID=UPI003B97713A